MIRLGKLEVTSGFFLLAAWLNYWDSQGNLPLVLIACTLHEMGHLLALLCCGRRIARIRLTYVGAEISVSDPMSYWQEGIVAMSGPGVNLLLSAICVWWDWGITFSGINLILGLFNLLPVGSLDGGRAMRAVLALLLPLDAVAQVKTWVERFVLFAALLLGGMLIVQTENITFLLADGWLISSILFQKEGK